MPLASSFIPPAWKEAWQCETSDNWAVFCWGLVIMPLLGMTGTYHQLSMAWTQARPPLASLPLIPLRIAFQMAFACEFYYNFCKSSFLLYKSKPRSSCRNRRARLLHFGRYRCQEQGPFFILTILFLPYTLPLGQPINHSHFHRSYHWRRRHVVRLQLWFLLEPRYSIILLFNYSITLLI